MDQEDKLPDLLDVVIVDVKNRTLRFNRKGIEAYGPRYGRVGFDVRKIRTLEQLNAADNAAFMREIREVAEAAKRDEPWVYALIAAHFDL